MGSGRRGVQGKKDRLVWVLRWVWVTSGSLRVWATSEWGLGLWWPRGMRRVSDAFQRLEGLLLKPEVKQVTAMRSFGRG